MTDLLRTSAALLVVLMIGLTLSGAQEENGEKTGLKVREDGKGLDLKGTLEDVPLSEVIQLYVEQTGETVLYDPKKLQGEVTINAPSKGAQMTPEDLVHSALKQFRLVMASDGNVMEIIPAAEAITQCETVDLEQLKELPPGRFVRVVIQLRASEANALRGAIQNLTTRQGGSVNPVPGANTLIIADYVNNLRDIVELIDSLEAGTEVVSRVYKLQHVMYGDIRDALNACLDPDQGRRPGAPSRTMIGATSNGRYLTVTGVVWEVDRIAGVIKQLDMAQDD